MKKSEIRDLIQDAYYDFTWDTMMTDQTAEYILNKLLEAGMLPPVAQVTVIPDNNGGTKHSPTERKWNKEDDDCCENEKRSMDGGCENCGDPCY